MHERGLTRPEENLSQYNNLRFRIQEQIANTIAEQPRVARIKGEQSDAAAPRSESPPAWRPSGRNVGPASRRDLIIAVDRRWV